MAIRPAGVLGLLAVVTGLASCGPPSGGGPEILQPIVCPLCVADTRPHVTAAIATLVDMGEVLVGEHKTARIDLVNVGTVPLEIVESRDDLTPFSTDLACSRDCRQRTVQVGANLDVAFTFLPSAAGAVERTVIFQSGAGPISVRLTGVGVIPLVTCDPPGILELGSVIQGTALTRTITCRNHSDLAADVVVEPVEDDTGEFIVSSGALHVGAGRSFDIPVTFSAALLPDGQAQVAAHGDLRIEEVVGNRSFTILLEANVLASALEVDPPPIEKEEVIPYDLGFVRPGSGGHMALTLRNLWDQALTISTLAIDRSSDPEFGLHGPATPFVIPAASDVPVELTFNPPTGDVGRRTGQLDIISDDPWAQVRFLDLTGFAGGPLLSCTWDGAPGALDFGDAVVGSSSTREIACKNVSAFNDLTTSDDNLRVIKPSMKDDASEYLPTIAGDPMRIGYDVGQGFTIVVQFSPQVAGTSEDQVVLRTNDPDHPELEIPVTGLGTP